MRKKITAVFTAMALVVTSVSYSNATYAKAATEDVLSMEKVDNSSVVGIDSAISNELNTKYAPDDIVTVIVELKDTPLLEQYQEKDVSGVLPNAISSFEEYATTDQAEQATDDLLQDQTKVADQIEDLKSVKSNIDVLYNYTAVMNGFATEVKYKALDDIQKLPNVKTAYVAGKYDKIDPVMDTSVDTIGASQTWDLNYKGQGIAVAILDTGLDTNHQGFKGTIDSPKYDKSEIDQRIKSSTGLQSKVASADEVYVSEKIPYAFDYADKDNDVIPSVDAVVNNGNDHGTHVAGTIAASDNEAADDGISGVAPDAQLMIMKVFSDKEGEKGAYTEDIVAALDDTVTLGADVINMSLGSASGFTNEGEQSVTDVYNRIANAGITLSISAGNSYSASYNNGVSGSQLSENPDTSVVGSPSTYSAATSVASVINGNYHAAYFSVEGNNYTYSETAAGSQPTFGSLKAVSGGAITYVPVPGSGTDTDYAGVDVSGKIALVKRGSISFNDKVKYANNHGAVGIVIYNNQAGTISMSIQDYVIPAVSVTLADGAKLLAATDKTMNINGDIGVFPDSRVNQLSDFSSWGVTPDLKLKPEISAPGENIYSTVPFDKYESMSGTSMAAPHIAGSFALLKQYLNDTNKFGSNLSDIEKARLANQLLMSTAKPSVNESGIYYSPRKQGSGLENVFSAVNTDGYLYVDQSLEENERPKLNLGDDTTKSGVYTSQFHIKNVSGSAISYTLNSSVSTETYSNGVIKQTPTDLSSNTNVTYQVSGGSGILNGNDITVDANSDVTVSVEIQLNDEAKKVFENFENGEFVEGFIQLDSKETSYDLSIPFMGFYGDWTNAPLFDSGTVNDINGYQQTYDALYTKTSKGYNFLGVNPFDEDLYYLINNDFNPLLYPDYYTSLVATTADFDKIAISPNNDGEFDRLDVAQLSLLRNAKELNWSLKTSDGTEIKSGTLNYERKTTYYSGTSSINPTYIEDLAFDGKDANGTLLENNSVVTFEVNGTLDYSEHGQNNKKDTLVFPITIDTKAPILESTTENGNDIQIKVKDNQYVAAVVLYSKDDLDKPLASVLLDEDNKDTSSLINIKLDDLGLTGTKATDYKVKIYDYAMNNGTYDLTIDSSEPTPTVSPTTAPTVVPTTVPTLAPTTPATPVVTPTPTKAPGDEKTYINKVKVSPTKKTLYVGGSYSITVSLPELTKDDTKTITFNSSNNSIASVSNLGVINAKKAGTAVITTTVAINKESKQFTTTITVKNPTIKFVDKKSVIKVGKSYRFTVKAYGVEGTPVFSVSNTKLAKIDKTTGKFTALKTGTVYVLVKIGSITQKYKVTIKK